MKQLNEFYNQVHVQQQQQEGEETKE